MYLRGMNLLYSEDLGYLLLVEIVVVEKFVEKGPEPPKDGVSRCGAKC